MHASFRHGGHLEGMQGEAPESPAPRPTGKAFHAHPSR